jgi:phosphatidylglycerophosphate synthase
VARDRTTYLATTVYVVVGLGWALFSGQPGPAWLEIVWFATVAAFGYRIPGIANQVSLARAYLAAPAFVYAINPPHLGFVAVVVAIAGLSDLVDGTIARRTGAISNLGGGLDPVVDGVFMGALAIGLALGGLFPLWLGLVVIARYLLPAVGGAVLIALHRRPELRHTVTGQVSTSLILILLGGICLFRGLNQDASALVAAAEVVIPAATVATYLHLAWVSRRPVVAPEPG